MNIINSLIMGIVEGVTEFLPISSTAHLIIVSKFLKIPQTDYQKFFEVFIQGGAILAVIFLYFQYLLKHKNISKKVIMSFLPTAIVGLLLYKIIKKIFFESSLLIIIALISIGIVFLILEYLIKTKQIIVRKPLEKLSLKQAFLVGIAQSIAVIPGVSRSGIVMITMMLQGYKRSEAAVYSFLLAVPTILAASGYDLYKMRSIVFKSEGNFIYLIIGLGVSFITAYISIKWLIGYLQRNTLSAFGVYRIVLGLALLIFGF